MFTKNVVLNFYYMVVYNANVIPEYAKTMAELPQHGKL